jgi:hypothetical protein
MSDEAPSRRHSGAARESRIRNLEIPNLVLLHHPGMTEEKMNHDTYPDDYIRDILKSVKSIAMVGASPVDVRPSYFAFKYLMQRGYDMIPVNPGHVGKSLLGRPFVGSPRSGTPSTWSRFSGAPHI